jgi:hypothetical protein
MTAAAKANFQFNEQGGREQRVYKRGRNVSGFGRAQSLSMGLKQNDVGCNGYMQATQKKVSSWPTSGGRQQTTARSARVCTARLTPQGPHKLHKSLASPLGEKPCLTLDASAVRSIARWPAATLPSPPCPCGACASSPESLRASGPDVKWPSTKGMSSSSLKGSGTGYHSKWRHVGRACSHCVLTAACSAMQARRPRARARLQTQGA